MAKGQQKVKKVFLEIKNCQNCPFFKEERHHTADSFETEFDWFCTKKRDRKIAGSVSWNEGKDVEIPKWCPLLK